MSLIVTPSELMFDEPEDGSASTHVLSFENTHASRVAFKVKTTAPKRYCVRPNLGLIPPKSRQDVQVIFQPRKATETREPGRVNRDKFLIESIAVPETDAGEDPVLSVEDEAEGRITSEQWTKLADGRQDQASHYKMKCSFRESELAVAEDADAGAHGGESSAAPFEAAPVPVEGGVSSDTAGAGAGSGARRRKSKGQSGSEGHGQGQSHGKNAELEDELAAARSELRRLREAAIRSGAGSGSGGTFSAMHLLAISLIVLFVGIVVGQGMC